MGVEYVVFSSKWRISYDTIEPPIVLNKHLRKFYLPMKRHERMRALLQGRGHGSELVPRCFQRAGQPALDLGALLFARPRLVFSEERRDHRVAHQPDILQPRFQ